MICNSNSKELRKWLYNGRKEWIIPKNDGSLRIESFNAKLLLVGCWVAYLVCKLNIKRNFENLFLQFQSS